MPQITLQSGDMVAMGLYLVIVLTMGFYFARNERTSEDFLLGGRKMPAIAVGISYMMSLFSTISLVSTPGEVFNHGLTMVTLGPLYCLLSIGAFYLFTRFYFRLNSFTPFEYLEHRYDNSVRVTMGSVYFLTRLLYVAMVLFTTAKVFEGGAGWMPWKTILLVGAVGIVYTVFGGMRAVIWTDVLQFVVLIGGILVAIGICISSTEGGIGGIISYAFENGRGPALFAQKSFYSLNPYLRLCFWLLLLNLIIEPLFYASSDQISVQRLLSTGSYRSAKKAIYVNAVVVLPFLIMLAFVGLAIFTYYGQNPDPRVREGDVALFTFISTRMPTPLTGLVLSAMLAAAMSTLDSGMNSLSAVAVKEFYLRFLRKEATEERQVAAARVSTVAIGIFAVTVAICISVVSEQLSQTVVEVAVIWLSMGVIFVPVYLIAITTRRVTSRVIWRGLASCWGMHLGMVTWYVVSKTGATGPIATSWVGVPLTISAVIFLLGALIGCRGSFWRRACWWLSLFGLFYSLSMIFWYLMSELAGGGTLSFLWVSFPGFAAFLLVGYGSTLFLPEQERTKYEGLTLWTLGTSPQPKPN